MTRRKQKQTFRPSAAEYAAEVQRQLIEVLITVAPDAAIPHGLSEAIISTDSLITGPLLSIADNLCFRKAQSREKCTSFVPRDEWRSSSYQGGYIQSSWKSRKLESM